MNKITWQTQHRIFNWFVSWIEIVAYTINIITLTMWFPHWGMALRIKYMRICMKRRIKNEKGKREQK